MIKEIKTKMNNLDTLFAKSSGVTVSRDDIDYTIKYDIKGKYIFISLSCEDLTNCTYDNIHDYEDTGVYDLNKLDSYEDNDLEMISHLLDIIRGGR